MANLAPVESGPSAEELPRKNWQKDIRVLAGCFACNTEGECYPGNVFLGILDNGSYVMAIDPAGDLTRLLEEIADGNEQAKNELFECVYEELHQMAKRHMNQERPGHTLGATGLVHEVYFRLQGQALQKNRPYFFAAAAKAMYRILVEHARRFQIRQQKRVPWDAVLDDLVATHCVTMLDLHEALEKLKEYGQRGKRQHEVVVQRFFGGLQWKEIATNLGVAVTTVEKDWQAARAWLHARLKQGDQT